MNTWSAKARLVELLLCSAGLGALRPWLDEQGDSRRLVAFVDTAARPLAAAPFVDHCRDSLLDAGCTLSDLDLTTANHERVREQLAGSTHVFVTGGHPVFLLEWAQRSGFLDVVRTRVAGGLLHYIGVSAGAALAGPSIEPLAGHDDPGDVKDHSGLGLVDFVILPHANRRTDHEIAARIGAWEGQLTLRPLADDRAVSVRGSELTERPSL